VTVSGGKTEITLRDDRCGGGCAVDGDKDWTGHWAVMRIERTNRPSAVRFDVWARALEDHAEKPDVLQLQ
jgi:hypothetical protein